MTIPPQMHASKWLQIQALLEVAEMDALLKALEPAKLYLVGRVCKAEEALLSSESFIHSYQKYIETLKAGKVPEEALYRPYFSSALSVSDEAFFRQEFADGRCLLRPIRPVIQLQLHRLGYSRLDEKFRPMVLGTPCVEWGIQFSYPQLFQEPATRLVEKVGEMYSNTALFKTLQRWIRAHTIPTPFIVDGKTVNVPMRLGKGCLEWINTHPQLTEQGLQIKR